MKLHASLIFVVSGVVMTNDWSAFVKEFGPLVYRCAWRILRQQQEAEDVVQDVFVAAWSDPEFRNIRSHAAWLRKLTVCRSLDRLRKLAPLASANLDLIPAADSTAKLELEELSEMVRRRVAELPEHQRIVFSLRYFEGMTNREIVETTGLTPTAISTALHAARKTLMNILSPVLKESD